MSTLAIIPARRDSRGLEGKNKKPICGQPLIHWTIEQAQLARVKGKVQDIIVVSNDDNILQIAQNEGVWFVREPEKAADDKAHFSDFVIFVLNHLDTQGRTYDNFVLLEPTSPLRDAQDIINCIDLLSVEGNESASCVVSIAKHKDAHPTMQCEKDRKGFMRGPGGNVDVPKHTKRQQIRDMFYPEGSVYVSKVDHFRKEKSFYGTDTVLYEILPEYKWLEIDTLYDFKMAECMLRQKLEGKL